MSSAGPRRRDAAASRERLLTAAGELFADRGYDRTTARDIGERADVDPAMIARYFGGKAQLYIAALQAEDGPGRTPTDLLAPGRIAGLLERTRRRGPGPVFQVAAQPLDDPAAQAVVYDELQRRLVAPLVERLTRDGEPQPQLRAELLVAAVVGVALARHAGTLPTLAAADVDEVAALLGNILGVARSSDEPDGDEQP